MPTPPFSSSSPPPPLDHAGVYRPIEFIARGLTLWGAGKEEKEGDRVLVCRNLKHGYAYLPGGHVDPGEAAAEACVREYLEETGMKVRAGRCLLVCEARFTQKGVRRHELSVVFHVEHPDAEAGGSPPVVASREPGIGFEWITREHLADADLRPAGMRSWLLGRGWGGSIGDTFGPDWISVNE